MLPAPAVSSQYSRSTASCPPQRRGLPAWFDRSLAGLGLTITAPLFLWIAWRIRREGEGPIFFRQERIGRGSEPFICLKFRSMFPDAEARLSGLLHSDPALAEEYARYHKLQNDPRITPFGRFLRRTSLDELPQLLNVLRGDMALVGPRPLTAGEIPEYGELFTWYRSVRPGLTGLWQVSGRSKTTFSERVALDRRYFETHSPGLDLLLLLKTLVVVFSRRGAC